jgi:hypothetical protein
MAKLPLPTTLLQQDVKTGLFEMMIGYQGFGQFVIPHYDERNAIYHGP